MLDSIREIGKKRPEPFPQSLVIPLRESGIIMKLIYSLDKTLIKDDFIELSNKRLQEYLWVGNAEGNKPQNRLTTDKLDYLINEKNTKRATYNIIQNIKDFWGKNTPSAVLELQKKLEKIEKKFFSTAKQTMKTKTNVERRSSSFGGKIVLYTVCVEENGKTIDLATTKGYKEFIQQVFLRFHETIQGRCHVCGDDKNILPDPSFRGGSILKIYATDKKGFTSGIADRDEARLKTFSICPECLRELLAGENYIQNYLRDDLGEFSIYLIPKNIRLERLKAISDGIWEKFGVVKGFKSFQDFEKELERESETQHDEFISRNIRLDLIFGAPVRSKFDFKYHIQDVPIFRLVFLRDEMRKIARKARGLLGDDEREWYLGFQDIRAIFPLRTQRKKPFEWKVLLELYSAMLNKTSFPLERLIKRATTLARIHRFGTPELYGIDSPRDPDLQLVNDVLKYNLFLLLLRRIGCAKMGGEVRKVGVEIPADVEEWWNEIGYDNKQKPLFLLGYLVGKVGSEQYQKGDKNKAILNKINFYGMSRDKILMLANYIFKSLRDYRILAENEIIYASMKSLLDQSINEIEDPVENLFYILSGYAFITRRIIIKGGEKSEK